MCGRYELHSHPAAIALAFGLAHPPEITARYNIAPTQDVPVVRLNAEGARELVQLRWGLVPRWAKDPSIGSRMINARAESVAQRSAFKFPFQFHRCLLPADGFYEWAKTPSGKQPLHIGRRDGVPLGLAGLYERWLSPEGEVLDTCVILTTRANELLHDVHDRMPVIVPPEHYGRWLDVSNTEVEDLFEPFPADALAVRPVSSRINAVRNDDASLLDVAESGSGVAPTAAPESDALGEADGEAPKKPVQSELF